MIGRNKTVRISMLEQEVRSCNKNVRIRKKNLRNYLMDHLFVKNAQMMNKLMFCG